MDSNTLEYYKNNAREVFNRYESEEAVDNSLLPHVFSGGEKVLDIGCGSGRDMSLLKRTGAEVYGIEPVEELRQLAYQGHPELRERIFTGTLPEEIPEMPIKKFDGILLSAVLMHIPDGLLFDAAYAVRSLLQVNGTLLVSIPAERDDMSDTQQEAGAETRDNKGRLMIIRPEARIRILFERLGFDTEGRYYSEDRLMRGGIRWMSLVFRFRGGGVSESVDRIESIIMQDRKSATYKLALLRALCDIAQKESNIARWDSSGGVHIPIEAVARKWIEYYWPIVESKQFIPQMRGEHEKGRRFIAFRPSLEELATAYSNFGGIEEFVYQRDEGRFDDKTRSLNLKTLDKG
ncbi:MAG: class I SAM-dependent methyltransferase [Spirochaetaceae bacterium]